MQSSKKLESKSSLKAKSPLKAKAKPTKQVKPSITKLKKKADTLWSVATRYRFINDDGSVTCITCGTPMDFKKAQCGHFIQRDKNILRYDEENTAPMCQNCNYYENAGNANPKYAEFIDSFYGDGTVKRLKARSKINHQLSEDELENIITECREQIEWYQKKNV